MCWSYHCYLLFCFFVFLLLLVLTSVYKKGMLYLSFPQKCLICRLLPFLPSDIAIFSTVITMIVPDSYNQITLYNKYHLIHLFISVYSLRSVTNKDDTCKPCVVLSVQVGSIDSL